MAKLVALGSDMPGQAFELKTDKTTIGRVGDNTIRIPHGSVSSHHCELLLQGEDVLVKDLNSKNGTFINNRPVNGEDTLKVGQILRLGQVELRFEAGTLARTGANSASEPATSYTSKPEPAPKSNGMFIVIGIVVVIIVAAVLWWVFGSSGHAPK